MGKFLPRTRSGLTLSNTQQRLIDRDFFLQSVFSKKKVTKRPFTTQDTWILIYLHIFVFEMSAFERWVSILKRVLVSAESQWHTCALLLNYMAKQKKKTIWGYDCHAKAFLSNIQNRRSLLYYLFRLQFLGLFEGSKLLMQCFNIKRVKVHVHLN